MKLERNTDILLWIDNHNCPHCGYGEPYVTGPKYGQSSEYKIICAHCREEIKSLTDAPTTD